MRRSKMEVVAFGCAIAYILAWAAVGAFKVVDKFWRLISTRR
jgi:hypothetical protein